MISRNLNATPAFNAGPCGGLESRSFDHTKLTFRSQGRDFRLTDVHGNIVSNILA